MTKSVDTEFGVQIGISTETGAARVQCRLKKVIIISEKNKTMSNVLSNVSRTPLFLLTAACTLLICPVIIPAILKSVLLAKMITAKEIN